MYITLSLSSTICIYTFQSRTAKMHYSVEIHGCRSPTITTIMNDAKYLQRLATTIEGTALYTVLFTAMLALKFKLTKGAPNLYVLVCTTDCKKTMYVKNKKIPKNPP